MNSLAVSKQWQNMFFQGKCGYARHEHSFPTPPSPPAPTLVTTFCRKLFLMVWDDGVFLYEAGWRGATRRLLAIFYLAPLPPGDFPPCICTLILFWKQPGFFTYSVHLLPVVLVSTATISTKNRFKYLAPECICHHQLRLQSTSSRIGMPDTSRHRPSPARKGGRKKAIWT